jgi:hypothetical protein
MKKPNTNEENVPQWRIIISIFLAIVFLTVALPFYLINELFKKLSKSTN